MTTIVPRTFHGLVDQAASRYLPANLATTRVVPTIAKQLSVQEENVTYTFHSHFHPYVKQLVERLIANSLPGLQAADTEYVTDSQGAQVVPPGKPQPADYALYQDFFQTTYNPNATLVAQPYPVKDLDFTSGGAYSAYNWELFYHAPLAIALQLSANQRFEEASRWLQYVFDPTDDSEGSTPERFWKVKPFQYTDVERIEDVLTNLSTGADKVLQQATINSIAQWQRAPFRPHVIARYRITPYMFKAVTAYLDNLIAWGDSLFRQDTGESVNEATQLYVLAANILGPKPQAVPKKQSVLPQTYASMRGNLDAFGNALQDLENDILFNDAPLPGEASDTDQTSTVASLGRTLYFCVPRNDNILEYWSTVADRLFKMHNSLNFEGVFRQLPLFEPPIDPALLARAVAAGLDIATVVNGINQPLPLVRFQVLVQKASEICQEVKSLGSNLLSAIEKEDNEALAILRARQETMILGLAEMVKYSQWQEAIKSRESLEKTLANTGARYTYYERQLGRQASDITVPDLDALDTQGLESSKFESVEPQIPLRGIEVDIAQDLNSTGGKLVSSYEAQEMQILGDAHLLQKTSAALENTSGYLGLLPRFATEVKPVGVGARIDFGGVELSKLLSGIAASLRIQADQLSYEAAKTSKIGGYARREQDWAYQSNLAAGEIAQIFKQLRAAQIREALAEREWKNHKQQISNAEEIERFLADEKKGKTANKDFYAWLRREVKGLYSKCFQLAFDVSKRAERALQHELGDPDLSYLQFDYMSGKQGLLAGEKLYLDVKRMESAFQDLNQRDPELTDTVSLLQLDPQALLQLRQTGTCAFSVPEEFFDLRRPGTYFRRIKNVAISLPCVAGPYISVNCTLTMQKSTIRKDARVLDDYARSGDDDVRFSDHFGSLDAVVGSSGQNDTGMFETNLRDERYLPFEGSGAVSDWRLELPGDFRQFDYDTISDVYLHLKYTARRGGDQLRDASVKNLNNLVSNANAAGLVRLFSIRSEFPSEWAKFKYAPAAVPSKPLSIALSDSHYPYWSKGRLDAVTRIDLFAKGDPAGLKVTSVNAQNASTTDPFASSIPGLLNATLSSLPMDSPVGGLSLSFTDNSMSDLWIAVSWAAK